MSKTITSIASDYIDCPNFDLRMPSVNGSKKLICGENVRALAAYYLQHQEKLEPSISIARLKQLLIEVDLMEDTYNGLQDLIDEAEKDGAK